MDIDALKTDNFQIFLAKHNLASLHSTSLNWSFNLDKSYSLEVMKIAKTTPVSLNLNLHFLENGVLVSGRIQTTAKGNCVRCLTPCTQLLSRNLSEMFYFPSQSETEEDRVITNSIIDLEQLFIDTIVADVDLYPLCRVDCRGLCSVCGENLNLVDPSEHNHPELSGAFASLKDFFNSEGGKP